MTAPNAPQHAPHFNHEFERNLFVALALVYLAPLVARAAFLLAVDADFPHQLRLGFAIGMGVAAGVFGYVLGFVHSGVSKALDSLPERLGLSSWGFLLSALLLTGDLVCRNLEAELVVRMGQGLEWLTLGIVACAIGYRALLRRQRKQ